MVDGIRDPKLHHLQDDAFFSNKSKRHSQRGHHNRRGRRMDPLISDSRGQFNSHLDKVLPAQSRIKSKIRIPNYQVNNPLFATSSVQLCRSDVHPLLKRLRYKVRERGTQLAFMPRDMSRHTVNTSHYVHRLQTVR